MTPWALRLIIANVVVFIVTMSSPAVTEVLALIPAEVFVRPWTPITYMFVHANVSHILFNMLPLFFFAPRLEIELGGRDFLLLYFISGLMGAALSFVFTPVAAIVGASGAVYGVMLGFAYFWPREPIYVWGLLPVQSRWMVLLMTVLSLYGGIGGDGGGIAHFAHLGGFLGGYLFLKYLTGRQRASRHGSEVHVQEFQPGDIEKWSKIDRSK